MEIRLSPRQRADLEAAAASERRVRGWRRYRAVLLLADGQPPAAVAATLGCSLSSIYGWAAAWRRISVSANGSKRRPKNMDTSCTCRHFRSAPTMR